MQRVLIHALSLSCALAATRCTVARPALTLDPLASMVLEVTVSSNGGTSFHGLAMIDLKDGVRARAVYEVDNRGEALEPVLFQQVGGRLFFRAWGVTRPGRQRRFYVYAGAEAAAVDVAVPDALATEVFDNGVSVANDYFAVIHRQGAMWMPDFKLPGDRQWVESVYLDDRLYDRDQRRGYWLRFDRATTVRVDAQGPLVTIVTVKGGYRHTSGEAPVAEAEYQYEYRAHSPVVRVRASIRQSEPRAWNELHFLHVSHRGKSFPLWAADGPETGGTFTDSKRVWTATGWGVLHNSHAAVGVVKGGAMTFHDNPTGFCEYVRDAVTTWRGKEQQFAGKLWLGPWQSAESVRASIEASRELHVDSVAPVRRPGAALGDDALARWQAVRAARKLPVWEGALPATGDAVGGRRSDDEVLLWNSQYAALFSSRGALLGLTHREVDGDFVHAVEDSTAWELVLGKPGAEERTLSSRHLPAPTVQFISSPDSPAVAFRWTRSTDDLTVTAQWRLAANEAGLRGRIRVQGQTALARVRFPVIEGVGEAGAVDLAIPRGSWGVLHRDARGKYYCSYPSGNWPMQFISLQREGACLYVAAEDGRAETKGLSFEVGKRLQFETVPPDAGQVAAGFAPDWDVVLAPLAGDWVTAAKRYRQWALKQVWCSRGAMSRRADIPKRFRDGLYWWLLSGDASAVVPVLKRAQSILGIPMGVHWYNWHQIPFDNDYPHYAPAKPGFKEAVAQLQGMGITVMPYINGRLWDSDTTDFDQALPWTTKDAKGQYYVEVYGSGEKLVPMCPFTKLWQDKMFEVTNWLYNDQGVDAIYMDQIGAARPRICMDPGHGHPLGGGGWWLEGYTKILSRIQKLTEQAGKSRLLTTENNAEPYIHLIDGFLVWGARRPEMVPLYAAVYSDRRIAFVSRAEPGDDETAFAMKMARDFLWGTQMGWMGDWLLAPENRGKLDYIVKLARARLALKEFLSYGEYLGPAKVECSRMLRAQWRGRRGAQMEAEEPAVIGARWRAADGATSILLTNSDVVDHVVDVRIPEALRRFSASVCAPSGEGMARREPAGDRQRVAVPARDVRVLRFGRIPGRRLSGPTPLPSRELVSGERVAGLVGDGVVPMVDHPTGMLLEFQREGGVDREWREIIPMRETRLRLERRPLRAGEVVEAELQWRLPASDFGSQLRLLLPEGVWALPRDGIAVDQPSGRRSLLLHADDRLRGGVYDVPVVVQRPVASGSLKALDPRPQVRARRGAAKVDGDLGEWKTVSWTVLDGKRGNHLDSGSWKGPADLSGRLAARCDGRQLYLAVDVADDVHHEPTPGAQIWQGDCVQVDFDPLLDSNDRLDGNDIELAMAWIGDRAVTHFWTPPPQSVQVAGTRVEGRTRFELALPLAFVTAGHLTRKRVGFSFTLNEAEGDGKFAGWLEWTPGICGEKSPAAWGALAWE